MKPAPRTRGRVPAAHAESLVNRAEGALDSGAHYMEGEGEADKVQFRDIMTLLLAAVLACPNN